MYWNLSSYNCSQVRSWCSLYTAELKTLYFVIICSAEDLLILNSNKFRMIDKVDGNPQLDSCDWSMYSNILKSWLFSSEFLLYHSVQNLLFVFKTNCKKIAYLNFFVTKVILRLTLSALQLSKYHFVYYPGLHWIKMIFMLVSISLWSVQTILPFFPWRTTARKQ